MPGLQPAMNSVSEALHNSGRQLKPRGLWAKVLLLSSSLLLCIVGAEVTLRLMGVPPPPRQLGDPILGFGTVPNRTETFEFPEYGGMLTMKTNNLGFHEDVDTPIEKTPGTYRMVFVGDSQTAGECANEESFPHVLRRILNRGSSAGRNVEVLDAAVGRYSPYQYYIKAKTRVVPLKPDHLVVGLYVGNDFMDLLRPDDRPYLVSLPDGTIQHHAPEFVMLDDPATKPSAIESSRLFGLVRRAAGPTLVYQVRRARLLLRGASGRGQSLWEILEYMIEVKALTNISLGFMTQSLLQQVWFRHFPDTLPLAFRYNRYVMALFKNLCEKNGIRLTYLIVPTKLQIEPEELRPVLTKVNAYDQTISLETLQSFENQLADSVLRMGRELGVEVIDVRTSLVERRVGRRFYNPEEMHLTPAGNRAIALQLYETLGRSISVSTPGS